MKTRNFLKSQSKRTESSNVKQSELDGMINKLNSKLHHLEGKYSHFVNHWADVIRDSKSSQLRESVRSKSALNQKVQYQDQKKLLEADLEYVMNVKRSLSGSGSNSPSSPLKRTNGMAGAISNAQSRILQLFMQSESFTGLQKRRKIQYVFEDLTNFMNTYEKSQKQNSPDTRKITNLELENLQLKKQLQQFDSQIHTLQSKINNGNDRHYNVLLKSKESEIQRLSSQLLELRKPSPRPELRLNLETINGSDTARTFAGSDTFSRIDLPLATDRPRVTQQVSSESEIFTLRQKLQAVSRERDMLKSTRDTARPAPEPNQATSIYKNKTAIVCRLARSYLQNPTRLTRRDLESYILSCDFNGNTQTPQQTTTDYQSPSHLKRDSLDACDELSQNIVQLNQKLASSEQERQHLENDLKNSLEEQVDKKTAEIEENFLLLEQQLTALDFRLKETANKTGEQLEDILVNLPTGNDPVEATDEYQDILDRYDLATQENIELQSRLVEEAEIHDSFQKVLTARINEANANLSAAVSENEQLKVDLQAKPKEDAKSQSSEDLSFEVEVRPRKPAVQASPRPQEPHEDLEARIKELTKELVTQADIHDEDIQKLDSKFEEQAEEYAKNLQATNSLVDNYKTVSQQLKDKLIQVRQENEAQLMSMGQRSNRIAQENQDLVQKVQKASELETELREKIKELEGQIFSLKENSGLSQQTLVMLQKDLKAAKDYADELEKKNEALNEKSKVSARMESSDLRNQLDSAHKELGKLQEKYRKDMTEQTACYEQLLTQFKESRLTELQNSLNKFDSQTQEVRFSFLEEEIGAEEDQEMTPDDFNQFYTDEIPQLMKFCKKVKYSDKIWWLIENDMSDLVWWRSDQLEEAGHVVPDEIIDDDSILLWLRTALNVHNNDEIPQAVSSLQNIQLTHSGRDQDSSEEAVQLRQAIQAIAQDKAELQSNYDLQLEQIAVLKRELQHSDRQGQWIEARELFKHLVRSLGSVPRRTQTAIEELAELMEISR